MKQLFKQSLLLAAALAAAACSMDKIGSDDPAGPEEGLGYLTIGGVALNVDTETTTVGGTPKAAPATRAIDTDGYLISIVDAATDTPVQGTLDNGTKLDAEFTYSSLFTTTTEGNRTAHLIALRPGSYYITARQPGAVSGVAADAPYYSGKSETQAVLMKKKDDAGYTPAAFAVTCKLANIKTTVELTAPLKEVFQPAASTDDSRLKTVVTVGSNSYTFEKDATHTEPLVYFKDEAGPERTAGNEMKIVLAGNYYTGDPADIAAGTADPAKYKHVSMTKTLLHVRAAQWHRISIDIDHNTTGNLQFVFTVESYVYDDTIDTDVTTFYADADVEDEIGEEEPDKPETSDPDAPTVLFANGTAACTITDAMYDADMGQWNELMTIGLTPKADASVASYYAVFTSDNADFRQALTAAGYTDGKVELYPANGAESYCKADATQLKTKPAGMAGLLKYAGTHTMKLVAKDSKGRTSYTTLTITVGGGSSTPSGQGPTVVWEVDDVIKTEAMITGSENVKCVVTSNSGLSGLKVEIRSDNETFSNAVADLFGTMDIDLFHLLSAQAETNLRSLGFLPVEKGKEAAEDDKYRMFDPNTGEPKSGAVCPYQGATTPDPFDITPFMAALSEFPGTHTFTLTATDAEDSVSGPIKFVVVAKN